MAVWDTTDEYFSGQGIMLIAARDVNGNPTGFLPVGNVPTAKLSLATSVLEHKESKTGARGTDLRLTTEVKCTLALTMENFSAANLATVLRGTVTNSTGATVTNHPIKIYLGKVVALPHIKISAVTITADDNSPVSLVENTDYWINADAGSIKFADTITGITDGEAGQVDYTYATQTKVGAMTEGAKDVYVRFEGLNTADENSPVVINVFKFSTDPLKELDLISDGVQQFVMEGSVLMDATRTTGSKYYEVLKL